MEPTDSIDIETLSSAKPKHIPVFIDEIKYEAEREITGQALRALPDPDVPENRDLWLEVHGKNDDELIRPEVTYQVKPGSKYYTAPSTINPGGARGRHE